MGAADLFFKHNNNLDNLIMNPLTTVRGAITTGFIVAAVVAVIVNHAIGSPFGFNELPWARWFHTLSGVMWIGLLYYFNVVQIPALGAANADKGGPGGAGIVKYVAPRALFWFRWGAVATWLTGIWYLGRGGNLANAFSLGHGGQDYYGLVIGIGAWLGTIMFLNVWAIIWPNQKKVLGIVAATDDEKAKARLLATRASRINFILSIPMLLCMGAASHGFITFGS
jgi:uncharacterized membrane protein